MVLANGSGCWLGVCGLNGGVGVGCQLILKSIMNFSEESLVLAVDLIFKKYDINEDGEIDADELFYMLEDAHAKMGLKNKPTNE